jgi:hypothetical protein
LTGAGSSGVGGCCISWKCLLRRQNVRSARSGRAGLNTVDECRSTEVDESSGAVNTSDGTGMNAAESTTSHKR